MRGPQVLSFAELALLPGWGKCGNMRKTTVVLVTALSLAACGGETGDTQAAADTLTRAQKDSIVADLPIPGANGVGGAMRARDLANERTARHDSIGR